MVIEQSQEKKGAKASHCGKPCCYDILGYLPFHVLTEHLSSYPEWMRMTIKVPAMWRLTVIMMIMMLNMNWAIG
ncbi:Hypothetical predicted protein [Octopus vulgaris]|uniref:Uncharacterized protein n=1 Tax=Octopus vulgaris TaxID=6645 RepID=A0AA36B4Z0_OCTVU|nr:Hypothetical predicted protein [Octopus vulgaris]